MSRRPANPLAGAGVALSLAVIAVVCLLPVGEQELQPFRFCVLCSERAAFSGFLLNVALYVPLGLALRLRTGSWWVPLIASGLVSGAVELAQLGIPGRFSALEDLIANVLGGMAGTVLGGRLGATVLFPEARAGQLLAATWSLVVVGVVAAPSVLVRPSVPDGDLFGQRRPELGGKPAYSGEVLSASIGGVTVDDGLIGAGREVARSLTGDLRLSLAFTVGTEPSSPVAVIRVVGEEHLGWPETVDISVDGDDLLYSVRYVADDFKLDRPRHRLPGALHGAAIGDTITFGLRGTAGGTRHVTLNGRDSVEPGMTAARGWTFLLYPGRIDEGSARVVDAAWLAVVAVPIGWWAGGAGLAMALTLVPLLAMGGMLLQGVAVSVSPEHFGVLVFGAALGGAIRSVTRRSGASIARIGSTEGTEATRSTG